jgi:Mn-dependent DtxR family transcriptional regulator
MSYTQQILDLLADGRERFTSEIASRIGVPGVTAFRILEEMYEGSLIGMQRRDIKGQEISAWSLAKVKE